MHIFVQQFLKILVVVIYYVINIVVRMFSFAYISDRKIRDLEILLLAIRIRLKLVTSSGFGYRDSLNG